MMRGNGWSRGAEEFDALVSGRAGDGAEHAELLELVAALRSVPPVTARPEFVSSLRTQLVAAAERAPAVAQDDLAARLTPRQRRGSRERRIAALVGGFAVVSATGSMAMAAQDSLPGDVLYPVKRAIENAQTNLQSDNAGKADSLLSHAEARLEEVQELTARDADSDVIASTLQDFTDQTTQASELALDDFSQTGKTDGIADLRAFAADSMDVLGALGPLVPEELRSPLITATQTVRQVDAAAWEACPTCADGGIAELPDIAALEQVRALLNVPVIDQAEATAPPKDRPKRDKPAQQSTDGAAPSDAPTTTGPVDDLTEKVGGAIDDITGGLGGGSTTGPKPTTPTTDTVIGNVLDGLGGVLGGLLK
ncbi:hypothetical protein CFH99_03170 [Nocardioides aromaticivorans]|uniref:DUF5667 domain-containing protein n=2 Tax=Nocardioides aromaticivorans TaxID=200618 RepID=A0ABX7PFA7_9ACTN|nr:hypothetical protein CFH99_03170 [Nocardioides aromaticivorans]